MSGLADMPLTGGDLRSIADAADQVEETVLAHNSVIGRIEVIRPDSDDQECIGHFVRFDESDPDMGWGFTPEATS